MEVGRLGDSDADQHLHLTLGDRARRVHALVANHEVALFGVRTSESTLLIEAVEEGFDLLARAVPGRIAVLVEQHPARAAFDARRDEERQTTRGQILP